MFGIILLVLGITLLVAFVRVLVTKQDYKNITPAKAKVGAINASVLSAVGLWLVLSGGPSHGEAVTEVLLSIPDSESSVHSFLTGDLAEGVAVVVNGSAGYWVKDGNVYAVNGVASSLAPGMDKAPQGITWLKIEKAAQ